MRTTSTTMSENGVRKYTDHEVSYEVSSSLHATTYEKVTTASVASTTPPCSASTVQWNTMTLITGRKNSATNGVREPLSSVTTYTQGMMTIGTTMTE